MIQTPSYLQKAQTTESQDASEGSAAKVTEELNQSELRTSPASQNTSNQTSMIHSVS